MIVGRLFAYIAPWLQVYTAWLQCMQQLVQLEMLPYDLLAGLLDHMFGMLLEDQIQHHFGLPGLCTSVTLGHT